MTKPSDTDKVLEYLEKALPRNKLAEAVADHIQGRLLVETDELSLDPSTLIGLTEHDATQKAKEAGYRVRVTVRDGKSYIGTCDFRRDRINFRVVGGQVTLAHIG